MKRLVITDIGQLISILMVAGLILSIFDLRFSSRYTMDQQNGPGSDEHTTTRLVLPEL